MFLNGDRLDLALLRNVKVRDVAVEHDFLLVQWLVRTRDLRPDSHLLISVIAFRLFDPELFCHSLELYDRLAVYHELNRWHILWREIVAAHGAPSKYSAVSRHHIPALLLRDARTAILRLCEGGCVRLIDYDQLPTAYIRQVAVEFGQVRCIEPCAVNLYHLKVFAPR